MKKGFTIIELVIVISVLIILIGIAIPHMKGMQQSGNIVKVKGELQTLQAAMESYYNNVVTPHEYPASSTQPCHTSFTNQTPAIITTILYDPFAGPTTEYLAAVSSNGLWYAFASVGINASSVVALTVDPVAGATTTAAGNICVTNGTGCP